MSKNLFCLFETCQNVALVYFTDCTVTIQSGKVSNNVQMGVQNECLWTRKRDEDGWIPADRVLELEF